MFREEPDMLKWPRPRFLPTFYQQTVEKGPAERGHVKSVKNIFDMFSRRANNDKNRQKVSKHF